MLRILTLMLVAWLIGCAPSIRNIRDPIVAVQRDGSSVCSGFAISESRIATSAHCVAEGPVHIVTRDQYERTSDAFVEADVVYIDTERDIAILSSDARFSFPLRMREPVSGEPVTAVSGAYDWNYSSGLVMPGYGFFADSSISIDYGWSGAPVIGRDGYAVGIVSRCMAHWDGVQATCLPNSAIFSTLP